MVPSNHDHKGSMNNNSKDGAKQAQPQNKTNLEHNNSFTNHKFLKTKPMTEKKKNLKDSLSSSFERHHAYAQI